MDKEEFITIKEASELVGVNISTIYRNISNLQCKTAQIGAKKIKYVQKSDIERFFCISERNKQMHAFASETNKDKQKESMQNKEKQKESMQSNANLKESMREVIEEFFEVKQSQLMKPIEEQALYRLGILETEVKHLLAEKETLRHENELLREQVKALPGPGELETKENTILLLQKEKEDLLTQVEEYKNLPEKLEDTIQKLQSKEDEIKELETKLKIEKEETEARLLGEKEEAIKEHEKEAQKQKEELESKLKAEEEEKARAKATAEEALKQLKELPAPVESIQQILLDNANNIKELSKEKETFQSVLKEHEATIKEKERALKELEELRRQELEQIQKQAEEREAQLKKEAEDREKQIAEAWKKELDLAKKPWWKFW